MISAVVLEPQLRRNGRNTASRRVFVSLCSSLNSHYDSLSPRPPLLQNQPADHPRHPLWERLEVGILVERRGRAVEVSLDARRDQLEAMPPGPNEVPPHDDAPGEDPLAVAWGGVERERRTALEG